MEQALRQSDVTQSEIEAAILFTTIDGVAQHNDLDPERYPFDAVFEALGLHDT